MTLACFLSGHLFYSLLSPLKMQTGPASKPWIVFLITGLICITAIAQWWVLFFPLYPFFPSYFTLLLFLLFLLFRKKILPLIKQCSIPFGGKTALPLICFGITVIAIMILNAGPIMMDDTESYHIQMIKWVREYGSVPGLANLHLRFGLNSSWFIAIAALIPGPNPDFQALNGLLSIWISAYLIEKNGKAALASLFLLLVALSLWPLIRGNATTANYDFVTTSCILVLFIESVSENGIRPGIEWVLWPFFLVSVRLLNLPLLLICLLGFQPVLKQFGLGRLSIVLSGGLLVLVPFLIRNTILSGYPFFPIYQLDLFHVDWKADKNLVKDMTQFIKYYSRVNNQNQPLGITMKDGFPEWIGTWYHFLSKADRLLTVFSAASYLALFSFWKYFKQHLSLNSRALLLAFFMTGLICFVFAPDPRFFYGPLLCGPAFLLLGPGRSGKYLRQISLFAISISIGIYSINKIYSLPIYRNWVFARPLPEPKAKDISLRGLTLHIPEKILDNWNPRCYGTDLPCLYEPDPRLVPRGKSLAEGFRIDENLPIGSYHGEFKIRQ